MALVPSGSRETGILQKDLFVGQAATSNGSWREVRGIRPIVVTVRGTFVGTVRIYVNCEANVPPDSDNTSAQFGGDITSPNFVLVDMPVMWIKAVVSVYTSGSINVSFMAG